MPTSFPSLFLTHTSIAIVPTIHIMLPKDLPIQVGNALLEELKSFPQWMYHIFKQCDLNLELNKSVKTSLKSGNLISNHTFLTPKNAITSKSFETMHPMSHSVAQCTTIFDSRRAEVNASKVRNQVKKDLTKLLDQVRKNEVLAKLFEQSQCNEEQLMFITENSNKLLMTFLPQLHSTKYFMKWAKSSNGLSGYIRHISDSNIRPDTREYSAAELICQFLVSQYPNSFRKVARQNGLTPAIPRLNAMETAALSKELHLSDKALFDVLGRTLKFVNNDCPILCPKSEFRKLVENAPVPKIEVGRIMRDERYEKYTICKTDLIEQMVSAMSREIAANHLDAPKSFGKFGKPLFAYRTSKGHQGVYYMDGMDYGNNTLQFCRRLNFGSPKTRRHMNNPDHESIDFRFAVVKCEKERHEIISKMNTDVWKSVNRLRSSQMIAIQNSDDKIKCLMVDKSATDVEICGLKVMVKTQRTCKKSKNKNEFNLPLKFCQPGRLRWFPVISHFQVLQVGDLCAQLTLQGRKGMSAH